MVKDMKETINGKNVFAVQWDVEKAIKMKLRLGQVFGSVVFAIAMANDSGVEKAVGALEKALAGKDVNEIFALMKSIVCDATVDGARVDALNFNEVYADMTFFYQVFFFMLKGNYSDFLAGKLGMVFKKAVDKI